MNKLPTTATRVRASTPRTIYLYSKQRPQDVIYHLCCPLLAAGSCSQSRHLARQWYYYGTRLMLPGSQDENKYMCSPVFGDPALPFLAIIECAGYGIIDLYRVTCRYIGHGMQELCRNQSEQGPCGRKQFDIRQARVEIACPTWLRWGQHSEW